MSKYNEGCPTDTEADSCAFHAHFERHESINGVMITGWHLVSWEFGKLRFVNGHGKFGSHAYHTKITHWTPCHGPVTLP